MKINDLSELQRIILKNFIKPGENVVDATLGKGRDSKILSELVGESGRVFSFDIQEKAIQISMEFLKNYKNIIFINSSHENIDCINVPVNCIVFNLGFLPSYDKKVTTKFGSTISAIEKGFRILKTSGIVSITSYLKHDNGEEYGKLLEFSKNLDPTKYKVIKIDPINQSGNSPKLIIIQKMI